MAIDLTTQVADLQARVAKLESVLIVGSSGDVTIKGTTTIRLDAGSGITLKASTTMSIQSSGQMVLKASQIAIN
jgi:uncharacterized protein (DUF2345 family)